MPEQREQTLEALAAAGGDARLSILTLGYTGLRWGEASALRVSDVDVLNRRIHVRRAVADVKGELVFGTPKSHAMRSVPITASLAKELDDAMRDRPADAPLFPAPEGGWLYLRNFRYRDFDPAVRRAELPHITPHTLRHTAASIAVSAGANVKAVQRMLGHASAAMTLDVYADLFDDDMDTLAERLETTASDARADYLRTGTGVVMLRQDAGAAARAADQHIKTVGPVGLEPTTRGSKERGLRCSSVDRREPCLTELAQFAQGQLTFSGPFRSAADRAGSAQSEGFPRSSSAKADVGGSTA